MKDNLALGMRNIEVLLIFIPHSVLRIPPLSRVYN